MLQTISAMKLRQNFGEILNQVQYGHDSVLVTKAGKPTAAIINIVLFNKLQQMREHFIKVTKELGQIYENVDLKIAEKEIAEICREIKEE